MAATKLLPSDELHFLRWFWKNPFEFVGFNRLYQENERHDKDAFAAYEKEFGRAAPADYKAGVT